MIPSDSANDSRRASAGAAAASVASSDWRAMLRDRGTAALGARKGAACEIAGEAASTASSKRMCAPAGRRCAPGEMKGTQSPSSGSSSPDCHSSASASAHTSSFHCCTSSHSPQKDISTGSATSSPPNSPTVTSYRITPAHVSPVATGWPSTKRTCELTRPPAGIGDLWPSAVTAAGGGVGSKGGTGVGFAYDGVSPPGVDATSDHAGPLGVMVAAELQPEPGEGLNEPRDDGVKPGAHMRKRPNACIVPGDTPSSAAPSGPSTAYSGVNSPSSRPDTIEAALGVNLDRTAEPKEPPLDLATVEMAVAGALVAGVGCGWHFCAAGVFDDRRSTLRPGVCSHDWRRGLRLRSDVGPSACPSSSALLRRSESSDVRWNLTDRRRGSAPLAMETRRAPALHTSGEASAMTTSMRAGTSADSSSAPVAEEGICAEGESLTLPGVGSSRGEMSAGPSSSCALPKETRSFFRPPATEPRRLDLGFLIADDAVPSTSIRSAPSCCGASATGFDDLHVLDEGWKWQKLDGAPAEPKGHRPPATEGMGMAVSGSLLLVCGGYTAVGATRACLAWRCERTAAGAVPVPRTHPDRKGIQSRAQDRPAKTLLLLACPGQAPAQAHAQAAQAALMHGFTELQVVPVNGEADGSSGGDDVACVADGEAGGGEALSQEQALAMLQHRMESVQLQWRSLDGGSSSLLSQAQLVGAVQPCRYKLMAAGRPRAFTTFWIGLMDLSTGRTVAAASASREVPPAAVAWGRAAASQSGELDTESAVIVTQAWRALIKSW
mmetsp:Transcript_12126/g.38885  ORF Transcript_12126/g.38885 Transcript_12126/m.38885 type:complete len:778 (-) Transcript_12126:311-2644(-)